MVDIHLLVERYESSLLAASIFSVRSKVIAENEKRGVVLEVGTERRYDKVALENGECTD